MVDLKVPAHLGRMRAIADGALLAHIWQRRGWLRQRIRWREVGGAGLLLPTLPWCTLLLPRLLLHRLLPPL